MLKECLDLINTKIVVKVEDKTITENLKAWREKRNITKADYLVFVGNILEELLEPIYSKELIEPYKNQILEKYFNDIDYDNLNEFEIVDTIKDIKVFSVNEVELMGYDDVKTDNEVLQEINSREQDPQQLAEWQKYGANGKWQKSLLPEHKKLWYKANYESCKL